MCTAPFRSALAFIFTNLAAAVATAGGPAGATAVELELQLAQRPQLYLVVDVAAPSLEVRARGMVLDRTPLTGVAVAALQPTMGRRTWPELGVPALWRVSQPPAAEWRRVVAPTELRQYSDSAAAEVDAVVTAAPEVAELPERYSFEVDAGWQVVVGQRLSDGMWKRLTAAAADSWRRWRGIAPAPAPPRLVLSMESEDARRLLHLFQPGTPMLVAALPLSSSQAGGPP